MVEQTVVLTTLKVFHFAEPVLTATIFLVSSLNMDHKHSSSNRLNPRDKLCTSSEQWVAYTSKLGRVPTNKNWTSIGSTECIDVSSSTSVRKNFDLQQSLIAFIVLNLDSFLIEKTDCFFFLRNSNDQNWLEIFSDVSKFLVQVLVLSTGGIGSYFNLNTDIIDFCSTLFQYAKLRYMCFLKIVV